VFAHPYTRTLLAAAPRVGCRVATKQEPGCVMQPGYAVQSATPWKSS